jgi:cell fate (sporulation/competence/biofilm development) regulator YmcA (YheA/YmcA/DUF963 family)
VDEFNQLLKYFKDQPLVKRYIVLEKSIHQDQALLKKYQQLKDLQKKLVNLKAKKQPFEEIEKKYNKKHEELLMHPLMGEYLEIVETLNSDLQMIQDIMTSEINMDL